MTCFINKQPKSWILVILEYEKIGFCLHISHKKVGLKKKDLLAEKQDFFSLFRKKKFYVTQKQELQKQKSVKKGFIWEEKVMIKTEKKKDFFSPLTYCIKKYFSPLE